MAALLAESIPPETRAWAMLWLVVLLCGLLGLLMVFWMIGRHRVHRYLSGQKPPRDKASMDAWAESARRLKTDRQEDDNGA